MIRKSLSALTLAAFLATSVMPAMAADFGGLPDMRFNPYGAQAQFNAGARGTTAGVYMRLPFKGGLKRPRAEARVGFAVSTRLSGQYHDPGRFAAIGTPRVFDLSLGLSSLGQGRQPLSQSLRLNGISLNQVNALYADEEGAGDEKKKGSLLTLGLILAGAAAVGIGIVLATSDCVPIGCTPLLGNPTP